MKRKILGILLILILISCDKQREQIIRPVETMVATIAPTNLLYEYPAIIIPNKEAPLSFRVAGSIKNMNVEVGSYVKEGEVIAEIDNRDYKIQLEAFQKKAIAAKSAYDASKAIAKNATQQFSRVKTLYQERNIPKKSYDEAIAGMQAAKAKEIASLAQYQEALQGVLNCKNQLKDTILKAPYDGYINKKYFDAGTTIGIGIPVVSISSTGKNKVKISMSEEEIEKINNISKAELLYKENPYKLKLINAGQAKEGIKLSYPVIFEFIDKVNDLPVDSEGIVKLFFKNENTNEILIPIDSIFDKSEGTKVWIYNDGKVNEREIKIIKPYSNGMVLVTGIKNGEKIVVKGVHELTEGQKVNLVEPFSKTNIGDML